MPILHKIKAYLYDNLLTKDNPNDFIARTQVEASDIVTNNPSELIVIIPALEAGTYKIEVVTQYSGSKLLKDPRTAEFDKVLTIQ